ncbi:alpha-(1,6)-fucosyltransferase 8 isoform X1 [Dermatophagoides pteronyssinus]|uniref:alpha-(1,6)-fucosyltransferase 8 isoform X1 n=2 Tax=Dermatophagoides pteronyssinus TaxID=6956 RepID=UPI003F67CDB5
MLFTYFSINNFTKYFILIFLFIFLLIIISNEPFGLFNHTNNNDIDNVDSSTEIILARLSRAMAELTALKSQNEELHQLIQNFIPQLKLNHLDRTSSSFQSSNIQQQPKQQHQRSYFDTIDSLDPKYEFSRRKLTNDVNELWNYIRSTETVKSEMKNFVKELKNSLLFDLDIIDKRDEKYRQNRLKSLSNYIQKQIHELQNPIDCKIAEKIVCTLNKGCGFGCQIHHLSYCMIIALATKRTLILNSKNWRYVNKIQRSPIIDKLSSSQSSTTTSMWELAFKPLSQNCLDDSGTSRTNWLNSIDHQHFDEQPQLQHRNVQVIDLPILDSLRPRPSYLPLTIPEEISSELKLLHGSPFVWFIGQILQYIMKPSKEIEQFLNEKRKQFQIEQQHPIVGIHVRRTDKINTEASFHSLSEYMLYVDDYFDRLELFQKRQNNETKTKRIVYLATDDSSVWKKEVPKFQSKGYTFIGDSEISNTASVNRRYSFDSLKNIILDVWMLSETDFIVCTFSSQVCRLAYELMQAKNPGVDRSKDFFSLDDIYYFGGQNSHNQIAILDHDPMKDSEITLKRGDIIGIAGNHWNGYSKGINRVTQQNGLYPGFKTKEKIETANFELFKNFQQKNSHHSDNDETKPN